ncbi:MAG: hypothetical protein MR427_01535 [Roseburia sp.]|nr:hypothetical protein [Roseburia sp.]
MINRVTATGCVVSIRNFDQKYGLITVAEKTTYRAMRDGKVEDVVRDDYIVFQFNEQTKPKSMEVINNLKKGDRVTISAKVNSYLKRNEDGSTKKCTNFYIESIKLEETEFSKLFGVKGGYSRQDSVSLCIEGIMQTVSAIEDQVFVTLNASENGNVNILDFSARGKAADMVKKIPVGERVYIDAIIVTRKITDTNPENERRDYNRLFIMNIIKASDVPDKKATVKEPKEKRKNISAIMNGVQIEVNKNKGQNEPDAAPIAETKVEPVKAAAEAENVNKETENM